MARNAQMIRQWRILKEIEGSRWTTVAGLADRHGMSPKTIRRDLAALAAAGSRCTTSGPMNSPTGGWTRNAASRSPSAAKPPSPGRRRPRRLRSGDVGIGNLIYRRGP